MEMVGHTQCECSIHFCWIWKVNVFFNDNFKFKNSLENRVLHVFPVLKSNQDLYGASLTKKKKEYVHNLVICLPQESLPASVRKGLHQ